MDREEQALFTVLQFTVKEWLYSKQPDGRTSEIEMLTPGGTLSRVGGRRIPRRPADIAQGLKVGHEYFVALDYGETPDTIWTDKYVLYSPDSVSELSSTDVTAVHPHSRWVPGILEREDSVRTRPGRPRTATVRNASRMAGRIAASPANVNDSFTSLLPAPNIGEGQLVPYDSMPLATRAK
jgi:hypothetical protein